MNDFTFDQLFHHNELHRELEITTVIHNLRVSVGAGIPPDFYNLVMDAQINCLLAEQNIC